MFSRISWVGSVLLSLFDVQVHVNLLTRVCSKQHNFSDVNDQQNDLGFQSC